MISPRAWLRHVARANLRTLAYRVAIVLCDFAEWNGPNQGGNIRPGHIAIASRVGLDSNDPSDLEKVKKAIKSLRDAGLLRTVYESHSRGKASMYQMTTPRQEERRAAGKAKPVRYQCAYRPYVGGPQCTNDGIHPSKSPGGTDWLLCAEHDAEYRYYEMNGKKDGAA